LSNGRTRDSGS